MTYLDYNATAPARPEVVTRMQELLAQSLNPSSVHSFGREAKKHLENARKIIADAISAWPNEIIFTASGTEANAMALRGIPGRTLLVSATEHPSVLRHPGAGRDPGQSASESLNMDSGLRRNDIIKVGGAGVVDIAFLDSLLKANEQPTLVSVMLANNETGVIQPINEVSAICKKHNALLHCDAVQGLGKIPVDFGALGCDMMTISSHKCGGPVGAAALIVRRDLAIAPLLTGGGQELGRRAGTENVAAIAGFAVAVEKIDFGHMQKLRGWLDGMESEMETDGATVFGKGASRLPNTACVAMPGVGNEIQLMDFDLKGFAISAGSACSSGRIEPSHVLMAMDVPKPLAASAIRISGGWQTTERDIRLFTEAWQHMRGRLAKKAG